MSFIARVKNALGIAERAPGPKPRIAMPVVPNLPLWNQAHRIGGGLTPAAVSQIIREADAGYMRRLIDLANESRQKDGHLQGCLQQAEECVAGLQWQVSALPDASSKEKKAAEWIESELRGNATFRRLLAHLAGATYYSYAVAEIYWKKSNDGKLTPGHFECLDARRFSFRQEDGKFVWWDIGQQPIDFRAEHPGKFIVTQPRVNGDVPHREGLARLLVWSALFRNWTITDWLRLGEIAWKPWRVGTYKKDAAKEDIDGLVRVLDGMSTNGVAIVPESIEVDVEWAPNGTTKPMHEVLYETVAREMSKAVLGQTETIQSSQSSGYAQAKVHDGVRRDLLESRAQQLAADITRDLVATMCTMNFGPAVRPPRFEFITQDPIDLKSFAEGLKALKDAGHKQIPTAWVSDQAGIPTPQGDEECLGDGEEDIPIDPKTGLPQEPAGTDGAKPKKEPAEGDK
jgi:phage gp29-like protein